MGKGARIESGDKKTLNHTCENSLASREMHAQIESEEGMKSRSSVPRHGLAWIVLLLILLGAVDLAPAESPSPTTH